MENDHGNKRKREPTHPTTTLFDSCPEIPASTKQPHIHSTTAAEYVEAIDVPKTTKRAGGRPPGHSYGQHPIDG